jgi:transposase
MPFHRARHERVRLNRRGNRQLNRALFTIAFTQMHRHEPARAYVERKRAEGKSWKEAMRCLKRHLANVVYLAMLEDRRVLLLTT